MIMPASFPCKHVSPFLSFSIRKHYCVRAISFLGKMSTDCRKGSSSAGKSRIEAEGERTTPKDVKGKCSDYRELSSELSPQNYEEEFPSLADSVRFKPYSSTSKIRLDNTRNEKKPHNARAGNDPLQPETYEPIISDNDELGLPNSFGKRCTPSGNGSENGGSRYDEPFDHSPSTAGKSSFNQRPKSQKSGSFGKSNPHPRIDEHGRNLMLFEDDGNKYDEPFDICMRRNFNRSPMAQKNRKMWALKGVQGLDLSKMNLNMFEETGEVLRPGMVLLRQYLPISEQVKIVARCQALGLGAGGFYRPGYKDGAKLRLYIMCLGLDWNPQTKGYNETRLHDNVVTPRIPGDFASMVGKILYDSNSLIKNYSKQENVGSKLPQISPDVCIVNFYPTTGRLGLHQDRDESTESLENGLPVVSVSIGDTAEFLYSDKRDVNKADSILLKSGDVLVFGGASRHIFHGVANIIPKTAPVELLGSTNLRAGRLNLTFRKY